MSGKSSHKLGDVARRELGVTMEKAYQTSDWAGDLTAEMLRYAAEDSRVLFPVEESLQQKVEEAGLSSTLEIEHRALPAIVWMSGAGVPFDAEGWSGRLREIEKGKDDLVAELEWLAPTKTDGGAWNWNSPAQVKEALALVGVTLIDTKERTLSRIDHPLANALLQYRQASKMTSTYGRKLIDRVDEGRIFASWFQMGAQTGRMTCSSPNLQNLPPEVRAYVGAPEGRVLVRADYSQIELRIAAKIADDARMLEAFANGDDIHTMTARSLVGRDAVTPRDRKLAKAVNFGLLYGMGSRGLRAYARANYDIELTEEEAEAYRERFFETYPGLRAWHVKENRELLRGATETRTLSGRRRTGISKLTERLNAPVQGTGADGLKLALALLYEQRGECPGAVPILAVHDEIVVECDEADAKKVAEWLERAMVDGMDEVLNSEGACVPVDVKVETTKSWG